MGIERNMFKHRWRKMRVEKQLGIYLAHFSNSAILECVWIFRISLWRYAYDISWELSEDKKREVRLKYVNSLYSKTRGE